MLKSRMRRQKTLDAVQISSSTLSRLMLSVLTQQWGVHFLERIAYLVVVVLDLVLALLLVWLDSVVMLLSIIMASSLVSSTSTTRVAASSMVQSGRVVRVHLKMSEKYES